MIEAQAGAVPAGGTFDGVVRLRDGSELFSGALLADGRHVLTAAHGLRNGTSLRAEFRVGSGTQAITVIDAVTHPYFDVANGNFDLAIVTLADPAPLSADRYQLYRQADEAGRTAVLAGWGQGGTGATGTSGAGGDSDLRAAENLFDATSRALIDSFGGALSWSPAGDSLLLADFDDGSAVHDAAGLLLGLADTGLGAREGLIAGGDSGGPAFLDGAVAGVAAYVVSLSQGTITPDADGVANDSSFGEFAAWTRVSVFQQWIDATVRADLPDAPLSRAEVRHEVTEGDGGTTLAYFLLELSTPAGPDGASVAYRTADGSARAGEDYLASTGRAVIHAGETSAVIPVEVIGDTAAEGDETFRLEVYDPQGGIFPGGALELVAQRTIYDNDIA